MLNWMQCKGTLSAKEVLMQDATAEIRCTKIIKVNLDETTKQDDKKRANDETAAREKDLEERNKDIEALTDKVPPRKCPRHATVRSREHGRTVCKMYAGVSASIFANRHGLRL